ncbi:MAG TPA: hypothetical protein PKJ56_08500, partial [Promineifilum sp.]|nr:hypothetical protein [Promineifilum sp.]
MKTRLRLIIGRHWLVLALIAATTLSVACRAKEPGLVIPTPPPPTSASPAVVPPTVAPSAELPTAAPPTSTTTPTASPILTATPPPATATAIPTALSTTTAVSTEVEYRVAFVAANDVLNVRRQPSPNAAIVTELAPDATGVHAIGEGQTLLGGSLWLP